MNFNGYFSSQMINNIPCLAGATLAGQSVFVKTTTDSWSIAIADRVFDFPYALDLSIPLQQFLLPGAKIVLKNKVKKGFSYTAFVFEVTETKGILPDPPKRLKHGKKR